MSIDSEYITIDCSEIPVTVIEAVKRYCQRVGFVTDTDTLMSIARDKYDKQYLQADGTYAQEATAWRKAIMKQGHDPDEIIQAFHKRLDAHIVEMKENDPEAYKKYCKETEGVVAENEKLIAQRKERYRKLHGFTKKDKLA